MAKRDENNYNDALGSIYDFLFEQAEKPPEKRKPVKPTGLSGGSEFVGALETIVANPAAYVGNTTMDSINEAFNADIVDFQIDKQGNKVELKANDIAGFLKNPNKFLDDQFKKAEIVRKQGRVRWLSRPVQQHVFTAWAKKNGFSMEEALVLGQAVGAGMSESGFASQLRRAKYGPDGKKMDGSEYKLGFGLKKGYDNTDILQYRTFTKGLTKQEVRKAFEKGWNKAGLPSSARKRYLENLLNQELDTRGGMTQEQLSSFLNSKGFDKSSEIYRNVLSEYGFEGKPEEHRGLLSKHFATKARDAASAGDTDGSDRYNRAVNILQHIGNDNLLMETRLGIKKLEDAKNALPQSQRNMNNSSYKRITEQLKLLKRSEADIKTGLGGGLLSYNGFRTLGNIEGFVNSWKASYGITSNLLPSIINGSFFDSRGHKNSLFSPSEKAKLATTKGIFEFNKGRHANVPYSNGMADMLNGIYYFTPAGIVSTLSTGEGFAFLLGKNRERIFRTLKNLSGNDRALVIQLGLDPSKGDFGMGSILGDSKKFETFLDYLNKNPSSPLSKKLLPVLNRDKRILRLADTFSWSTKLKNSVGMALKREVNKRLALLNQGLDEATLKELGLSSVISKYVVTKVLASKIWKKGVEEFLIKRLGEEMVKEITELMMKEGLRAAVVGLFSAVGTTIGGPIGTAVGWLLSEIVMNVGYQLMKVIILLIMLITLGLVASLLTSIYGGASALNKNLQLHNHVLPTEVVSCETMSMPEIGVVPISGQVPGANETVYSGTVQSIFGSVAKEFGLSTPLVLCPPGVCPYMYDWAWCINSGGTIYCKADKLNSVDAGTVTRLMRHELLHQVQARNGGGADVLIREWGADYLSGNGGGYCFVTPSGYAKATATRQIFIDKGCDDATLEAIARNESSAVSSSCGSIVRSYINNFARGKCN